jgi:hypothetical protein
MATPDNSMAQYYPSVTARRVEVPSTLSIAFSRQRASGIKHDGPVLADCLASVLVGDSLIDP